MRVWIEFLDTEEGEVRGVEFDDWNIQERSAVFRFTDNLENKISTRNLLVPMIKSIPNAKYDVARIRVWEQIGKRDDINEENLLSAWRVSWKDGIPWLEKVDY